jgi:recombination protein RecR
MQYTSESIEKLVELFSSLPTIGRKTAQRLTFHILRQSDSFVEQFANAMLELKKNVKYCSVCHNFTDTDPCPICSSIKRDKSIICVVEQPSDVMAIEKTNEILGFIMCCTEY